MGIKLSNNAFGTLAASINSSATSITLTTGQGARFPSLGAGDYFYATLIDTSNNLEIVKCTARSTDVLTVVRAQESTTARAYNTGDRIEIRLTAQTFIDAVNEIGPTQISDKANTSTGSITMPVGTTAQRPATPAAGMIRHNTTTGNPEWYDSVSAAWVPFNVGASVTTSYLIVAGGGSGATSGTRSGNMGGGGGAGGMRSGTVTLKKGTTYTATVGAGGAATGPSTSDITGNNGNSSSFSGGDVSTITSTGGGAGGPPSGAGFAGGSGGGGGSDGARAGGSGTAGQGNAGGNGVAYSEGSGGGGGGAGAAGQNGQNGTNGAGGAGASSSITGSAVTYAGGGGAGGHATYGRGLGGSGGGGNGGTYRGNGSAGTANTGGGGGGSGGGESAYSVSSGAGGSGVVIISVPTAKYSGVYTGSPTITTSGSNTIITFTASGTYTA